jgi:glycosyltransferase involved in cell wall biosynthesis
MNFKFEKEAFAYSPDLIIVHNYRHIHTTKALRLVKMLRKNGKKCKIFLVTHAPFVEGNITRSFFSVLSVKFYDNFIGPATINKFDKILAISKWEIPYLINIGANKDKIVYIPNGIPEEFFKQKKSKEENKILFLGRISPKKKIETLLEAIPLIKDKKIKFEIVGPKEINYFNVLKHKIKSLNVKNRVKFSEPIYVLDKKIKKIDSCRIFVLPSRVEGMPQSLIEAMSREKIVIGSDSIAIRDLIKNDNNGYLFEFDNPDSLARAINKALDLKKSRVGVNAKIFAEQFTWDKIIKKLSYIIESND